MNAAPISLDKTQPDQIIPDLLWFTSIAYHHLDWLRKQEWDARLWTLWLYRRNLIKFWYDSEGLPVACLAARPISITYLHLYRCGELELSNPSKLLYEHQPYGKFLWVDLLWAPGMYDTVIPYVKSLPQEYAGWQHRSLGQPHIVRLADLPDKGKRFRARSPS